MCQDTLALTCFSKGLPSRPCCATAVSVPTACTVVQVEVTYLKQDISDVAAVAETLERLPEHVREVDVLVNNAGLALGTAPAHEVDMEARSCNASL